MHSVFESEPFVWLDFFLNTAIFMAWFCFFLCLLLVVFYTVGLVYSGLDFIRQRLADRINAFADSDS